MNGNLESELDMLHEEIEEYRIRGEKLNSKLHERSNDFELWEAEATTFYFDLQACSVHEVLFENKMHELTGVCENLEDESASKSIKIQQMRERDDLTEKHLPVQSFGTVLARGENQRQTAGGSDLARKKLKPDR
ncbi:Protein NETWORKED 1A [Vitis vinifera]|uniref:Protein NETWORKED 1A n=1 Tax=Vitis vinifera TaxID=29760 RepID=A0A438J9V8_VITVI|nr:Protein NETWORKED 1A [Vitis vinifera]